MIKNLLALVGAVFMVMLCVGLVADLLSDELVALDHVSSEGSVRFWSDNLDDGGFIALIDDGGGGVVGVVNRMGENSIRAMFQDGTLLDIEIQGTTVAYVVHDSGEVISSGVAIPRGR